MADLPYTAVQLSEIPIGAEPEPGSYEWRPVRHYLGVESFGVNAMTAVAPGDWVIGEHSETEESATRHEELFFVASGHATFVVAGNEFDAPSGTFVHVPDPDVRRGARAVEPGTTIIAIGAEPGAAYAVSAWEQESLA